jgi:hypothetical protein
MSMGCMLPCRALIRQGGRPTDCSDDASAHPWPVGTSDLTHGAAGFFIRPLPRHSVHFGGKILRPGCVGCLIF